MDQILMDKIYELKQQIRDLDFKLEMREKEKSSKRMKLLADAVWIFYIFAVVLLGLLLRGIK